MWNRTWAKVASLALGQVGRTGARERKRRNEEKQTNVTLDELFSFPPLSPRASRLPPNTHTKIMTRFTLATVALLATVAVAAAAPGEFCGLGGKGLRICGGSQFA